MDFGINHSNDIDATEETIRWKFRDLKIYTSTEWLADNKKKYRQVFDRLET
ncbi:MAG: hypothetical protein RIR11_3423, partial [Bacteroidota bacterium]